MNWHVRGQPQERSIGISAGINKYQFTRVTPNNQLFVAGKLVKNPVCGRNLLDFVPKIGGAKKRKNLKKVKVTVGKDGKKYYFKNGKRVRNPMKGKGPKKQKTKEERKLERKLEREQKAESRKLEREQRKLERELEVQRKKLERQQREQRKVSEILAQPLTNVKLTESNFNNIGLKMENFRSILNQSANLSGKFNSNNNNELLRELEGMTNSNNNNELLRQLEEMTINNNNLSGGGRKKFKVTIGKNGKKYYFKNGKRIRNPIKKNKYRK